MENYCNFDIVIDGKAGHYTVCATAPDGGRTQPEPLRQISDDATRPLFAQLRSGSGVTAEALAELGIRMFDALFTRDVSRTYTAIQADLPPDQQLRLRLVVRPPELAVLPWELLYDPQERTHLSTSHGCPLVRYLETGKSFQAERIEGPLHVLYASAEPKDQRDLHLHKSLRNLRASLADLETQGQVELQVLEHATSKGLQEELGRGHHIFHFDGHATFDQDQGYLILEKDRQSDPFPGNLLASFVAGKGLRLVVLNACETASAVPADPLAGVAQQLVVTGRLPVVVAMQFRIMNRSAAAFTQQFYGALAAGFAIEGAVAEGRMAIMRNLGIEYRDHIDWAAPVLFMQTAKSHLWERPAVELERRRAIKLSGVPEPPPYFLARPAALQALKALVLGQTNAPAAVADRTPRVGLCGMGGTGKTVLAAGLARDGTVQQAFPDGIYWLVLGQEPKLTARQAQLARALGEPTPRFDDSEQGKACLSELLDGKRCLLVLDDVWDVRHVAPFEALGPDCLMLVTTRDAQLLTALGAKECRLDVLDDESALKLLADWASQKVSDLPPEALQTAQECGNLPLALSMAGAMVRGKPDRWRNVLHRLQTADLARIRQQFPDYPYPDLLRMIEASVQTLEPDVQSRYLELAVFSKDTPVPEAVLGTLWRPAGLDAYDVQDVIDVLVDRSMAHRDKANRLALHDLLHDYVHIQAKDHLPALHNRLLQAYANQCPGDWPSGPNDGYFFQHLAHHLKGAEREKEFYALLTRSPDWMEHKFLACAGDTAYLADLKLALTDFADPLTPAQLQTLVGLHTAQRVVHERVRTYSDADLKTLVWLDRGAEALSHTRLRASAWGRLRGLLAICHTLREKGRPNPALLDEAAEAASEIQAGEGWAAAQGALAAALAQAGRFTKARKTADGIEDREQRASALSELAAALARSGRFVQARKTASQIRDPALEASALSILGAALVKAGRDDEADTAFKQAQETACGIQDDERQASALRDLAAALTEAERLDQARGVAQKIESYESWVDALGILAVALDRAGHQQEASDLFKDAWEIADAFGDLDWDDRDRALAMLAAALARAERFEQAREMVRAGGDYPDAALATALAQAQRIEEAWEAADAVRDDEKRAEALRALAVALAKAGRTEEAHSAFEQAKEAGRPAGDEEKQVSVLSALGITLAQAKRDKEADVVFAKARETADRISPWHPLQGNRARTLRKLATTLARAGRDEEADAVFGQLEQMAHWVEDLCPLARTLAQVGWDRKADEILAKAQKTADAIEDDQPRASALCSLATALVQTGRGEKADEVLTEIRELLDVVQDRESLAYGLSNLAAAMARAGRIPEAWEMANAIPDGAERVSALSALAAALARTGDNQQAQAVFTEATETASAIQDKEAQAYALRQVAAALVEAKRDKKAGEVYEQAVQAARKIGPSWPQANALSALVSALARARRFGKAARIADEIQDTDLRAVALCALATAFAQDGRFAQALNMLGPCTLEDFLPTLTEWTSAFERMEPGLTAPILQEAIRIAGWIQPGWREIYDRISHDSSAQSQSIPPGGSHHE